MFEESIDRPFTELPAALVEEVLQQTKVLSQKLLAEFEQVRICRQNLREQLTAACLIQRDSDLTYVPIPTVCGVDGSYAVERLLANDLVVAAAVAIEGLTPPSENRYWPEPHHLVWIQVESHQADTGTMLRAMMMGMELELASQAPHEVVLLDGSLTTPLIYFNQALNKAKEVKHLQTVRGLLEKIEGYLKAYANILASTRADRCWTAIPKYTTRREIGQELSWPDTYDDRGLLSLLLEPGEFTRPKTLQKPSEPWHLNLDALSLERRETADSLSQQITGLLSEIQVIYYRPYPWLPALRLEMSHAVSDSTARLATILHAIRHQCGTPAAMEPFPLYMADRMVKHLPKAIPTFRQVITQHIAEIYQGNVDEVFLGLHGYRTESGG